MKDGFGSKIDENDHERMGIKFHKQGNGALHMISNLFNETILENEDIRECADKILEEYNLTENDLYDENGNYDIMRIRCILNINGFETIQLTEPVITNELEDEDNVGIIIPLV